jgi:spore maturation protein CgeB
MKQLIHKVLTDRMFAEELAISGLTTVTQRHTCAHRVDELFEIYAELVAENRPLVAMI